MATPPPVIDDTEAQPLVHCTGCGFAWYGRTTAHGLSVIGHCSRCGGALQFHDAVQAPERPAEHAADAELQPWQVLGSPTSWAHLSPSGRRG